MADDLYTSTKKPEDPASLSVEIISAITELQKAFPDQKIEPLYWNKDFVAVPIEVKANLPTRGPVGRIDIREREPIYLLLHRRHYPNKAPSVWSNRLDFPAAKLPHLNPRRPGMPANFCLHRGSLDNWFAEHTIVDLVDRVRAWLRDAGMDRLIRREDGFEPFRISEEVLGYSIYEPSDLRDHVYRTWRETNDCNGYAFLWYQLLKNPSKEPLLGKDTYAVRLFISTTLNADNIAKPLELSQKINSLHTEDNKLERVLFGVLAWPSKMSVRKDYFTEIPDNLGDFQEWGERLGIPLKDALQTYLAEGLHLLGGVPITIVVPRPQKIIGTNSRLELLNFVVNAGGEHWPKEDLWDFEARVSILGHRVPLTLPRARDISSQPMNLDLGRLLFLGCGAVGSKLILHLVKSGQGNMTLVDHDELSPHNLVRHGLFHENLGVNKAQALKNTIEGIFYVDRSIKVEIIKDNALNIFFGEYKDILNQHSWLIDATASSMMLNMLSQADFPETLSCCRCEIADQGRLGLLNIEGVHRNPRLDDLQILTFDMAVGIPSLSRWLQSNREQRGEEVGSVLEDIYIGISCSSETMRLSDELVSLHAASFATGFRNYAKGDRPNNSGRIQITRYGGEEDAATVVFHHNVLPMVVVKARNNPTWEVRLKHGLDQELKSLLRQAKPNETGGILIGLVNFNRKTIYVTRILPAPRDSIGFPYAFVRGVMDIPDQVFDIQELTGGMVGYVGEWHSHPMGGPELSWKDREAVEKIKANLDSILLPTHVMIVTSRGLYPHIFSPE